MLSWSFTATWPITARASTLDARDPVIGTTATRTLT